MESDLLKDDRFPDDEDEEVDVKDESASTSCSNSKSVTRQNQPKGGIDKQPKRVACKVINCSYSTRYKKDLVRHMRKHTGEKPFSCEKCEKKFSRYDKLLQHTRVHEGVRAFKCAEPGCTYTCIDTTSLNKHTSRVHLDEKPFACQHCPYRAKDSNQLNIHTRFHTGDSPYICSSNGCSKAFKTTTDLRRHIRVHTQEKPFCCNDCDYASTVKCNLSAHIKRKHSVIVVKGSDNSKSAQASSSSPPKKPKKKPKTSLPFHLLCRFCGYKTETIKSFKLHMLRKHRTSNYDSILNEFGKPVKSKRPRTQHLDSSQILKKYVCSYMACQAKFVSQKSLQCHVKQHDQLHPPPAPTVEVIISAAASLGDSETESKYSNVLALQNKISKNSGSKSKLESNLQEQTDLPSSSQQKLPVSVIAYADSSLLWNA